MLPIGEFAHLGGLTTKALRNYDLRGVFHPAWVDPDTGYRYYSPAQLPALRRIIALKALGIPLTEVAALTAGGGDLRTVLEDRRRRLEAMQTDIARSLVALDIMVEADDGGSDVVVTAVPSQRIAGLRARRAPGEDIGPLFHELELVVGGAGARANRPPGSVTFHRGPAGVDVEVFVPVMRDVDGGRVVTRTLTAATRAAVIHRGPYKDVGRARAGLERWMRASGWERAGPDRSIYLRFGAEPDLDLPPTYLAERSADYITELQIPVRHRAEAAADHA